MYFTKRYLYPCVYIVIESCHMLSHVGSCTRVYCCSLTIIPNDLDLWQWHKMLTSMEFHPAREPPLRSLVPKMEFRGRSHTAAWTRKPRRKCWRTYWWRVRFTTPWRNSKSVYLMFFAQVYENSQLSDVLHPK